MEKAIDELKINYRDTKIPMSLEEGLEDLFLRIEKDKKAPFYYTRMFAVLSLMFIILTAFGGMTLASKSESPLYPVKNAAIRAVENITNKNMVDKDKFKAITKPEELKKQPTSTLTPSPALSQNEKSSDNNDNKNAKQKEAISKEALREVKGINTVSPTQAQRNQNENAQQNSNSSQKAEDQSYKNPSSSNENANGNSANNVPQTQGRQEKGNNK